MKHALIVLLLLSSALPVMAQDISSTGCVTNQVTGTVISEPRFFCEPMESVAFIQFNQFVAGLEYLEATYPDFVELKEIGQSVGGLPILFVEITNENSATPRDEKLQLGYSASIHANEAAGREGTLRMIEDLAAGIGPHGAELQPLLDVEIVNVWFPNPDSWATGDIFTVDPDEIVARHQCARGVDPLGATPTVGYCVGFDRANALGVDLNREFPSPGIIHTDHTPMSEPESQSVVKELRFSGNHSNLVSGVDLHGMIGSPNMIRSIIPNQDYDFRRMVLAVEQLRLTQERVESDPAFADWNTLGSVDNIVEDALGMPIGEDTGLVAADIEKPMEWGTRWDMIDYTDTGFTSDYLMLSPRSPTGGMGAVGTITEFAYSHIVPDNKFVAKLTDMHVAGVRQIMRTQMEMVGRLDSPVLSGTGDVAYAWTPEVVSSANDPTPYVAASGKDFDINDESTWFDFNQVEYEVTNLNFWRDLGRFSENAVDAIPASGFDVDRLDGYETFVITNQALDAFSQADLDDIQTWVESGGHLLLTDSALRYTDMVGLGGDANTFNVYLAHSDVQDWDHALMDDVDWAARGIGEGPAVGMQVGNHYPQWAFQTPPTGTEIVGTTNGQASVGRILVGSGSIDFIGGMLPMPVQEHAACGGQCSGVDHRYGLADYSVSAFAYWLVMNSLGGEIAYEAIEAPFIPYYEYDPIYGGKVAAADAAADAEKDTPFLGVGLLLVGLAFVARRRF
jgi:hypothetical protein